MARHMFVQQPNEGVVTNVVKEPTLHVNGLCSTSLPSPTSTSKEQADSVISELTTTTTDPAEFRDMMCYTSGAGFSGNLRAKLEGERGTKFEHSDLDADIDELCCNAEKEFEMLPQDLKPLTLHCSLFPANYEFEKDMLIQLWIAGDLLGNMQIQDLEEDSGNYYFDYLLKKKFVVLSRFDHICGDLKYKINPAVASVLEKAYTGAEYLVIEDWKLENISEKLQHLCLACEDLQIGIFDAFKKCSSLQTLLVLSHRGSTIEQIPLRLRSLASLSMRGTNISELPDSICNAISLRYSDLSETPIRWLPESFDRLCNLQTLKLKDCLGLVGLPNGMSKLTNLQHLVLDNAHKMVSMPSGMCNLTSLRNFEYLYCW